jgi:hypothetical protein
MEYILSALDRVAPANIQFEIGRHELDCASIRRDLADGRAHFLGSPHVPDGGENAPAFIEELSNAVSGDVA